MRCPAPPQPLFLRPRVCAVAPIRHPAHSCGASGGLTSRVRLTLPPAGAAGQGAADPAGGQERTQQCKLRPAPRTRRASSSPERTAAIGESLRDADCTDQGGRLRAAVLHGAWRVPRPQSARHSPRCGRRCSGLLKGDVGDHSAARSSRADRFTDAPHHSIPASVSDRAAQAASNPATAATGRSLQWKCRVSRLRCVASAQTQHTTDDRRSQVSGPVGVQGVEEAITDSEAKRKRRPRQERGAGR